MEIIVYDSEIEQPKDKGILLRDILQPESEVDEKYYQKKNIEEYITKRVLEKIDNHKSGELFNLYKSNGASGRVFNIDGKSCTLLSEGGGGGAKTGLYLISDQFTNKNQNGAGFKYNPDKSYTLNTVDRQSLVYSRPHGNNPGGVRELKKSGSLTSSSWQDNHFLLENSRVRKLTTIEACRLQTVPDDFFNGSDISDNQQYSCLGDGWTVDVICHILQGLKTTFKSIN